MDIPNQRTPSITYPSRLSTAQIEEFKAEGALPLPGLIPPDVLAGWQDQFRAACSDGVDLTIQKLGPPGAIRLLTAGPNCNPACTICPIYSLLWNSLATAPLPLPTRPDSRGARKYL